MVISRPVGITAATLIDSIPVNSRKKNNRLINKGADRLDSHAVYVDLCKNGRDES